MPREFYLLLCVACARAECYGSRLRPANLINLDVIPSLSKGSYESLQLAASYITTKRRWFRYARNPCCLCFTLQRKLQGRQLNDTVGAGANSISVH